MATAEGVMSSDDVPELKLKSRRINQNLDYTVLDCFIGTDNKIVMLIEDNEYNSILVMDIDGCGLNLWTTYTSHNEDYGCCPATLIGEGHAGEVIIYSSQNGRVGFSRGDDKYSSHLTLVTNASCMFYHQEWQMLIFGLDDSITSFNRSGEKMATLNADHPRLITMDSQSRLYYVESDKIICRTTEGDVLKTITKVDLSGIRGMTLDKNGNLYVTSSQDNNVVKISLIVDETTTILSENDGLINPSLLHISHDLKTFLVINKNNLQMCLYDIL